MWRWTGFNMGLDLIVTYDNFTLSLRRNQVQYTNSNTNNEHNALLSTHAKRNVWYKVKAACLNEQKQVNIQRTGNFRNLPDSVYVFSWSWVNIMTTYLVVAWWVNYYTLTNWYTRPDTGWQWSLFCFMLDFEKWGRTKVNFFLLTLGRDGCTICVNKVITTGCDCGVSH